MLWVPKKQGISIAVKRRKFRRDDEMKNKELKIKNQQAELNTFRAMLR